MGILDTASSVAEDPGPWSMLIYGDWGSGKTVFAAHAEGYLMIDCEKSRRSLLNHEELVDTPILKVTTVKSLKNAAAKLLNDKDERIKTVGIDTIDSLQRKELESIMREIFQKDPNSSRDPDLPSEAEFNRVNRRVARAINEILDACEKTNRNLIILCHIREDRDDQGTTVLIRPATTPALTNLVAPMVDAVFYMSHRANAKGETERKLYTVATNKIKGKNRFGPLPAQINDPHISTLEKAADDQKQKALNLIKEREKQNA